MLLHTNARLFGSSRPLQNTPMLCRRWQPTRAASPNGKQPQQQQEDDAGDPVAAMLWAAQQHDGVHVVFEGEGAEELDELDDVLDDLEDPWMRNPSPPEWAEAPLFGVPDMPSSSSSDGATAPGTAAASDPSGSRFATVSWQQLQQQMQEKQQQQQQQQQQQLVVLEVKYPEDPQQQQQQPCSPLPDPLPWPQSGQAVERVTVDSLVGLTRELAAAWQQEGAVVAVWDSGHHSCLAAAIRLSAVYRLPHVVLLQQQDS